MYEWVYKYVYNLVTVTLRRYIVVVVFIVFAATAFKAVVVVIVVAVFGNHRNRQANNF